MAKAGFLPSILDTHTIEWDFDNGTTATDSLTPIHVYPDDDIYLVTLTIADNDAATTQAQLSPSTMPHMSSHSYPAI